MTTQFSCLSNECVSLLLDASVVVNLNATGYADRILRAIPPDILVPRPVIAELYNGMQAGHTDAIDLQNLLEDGVAVELPIPIPAQEEYIGLVSGTSVQSLGDGEAATIACAHRTNSWAAIDERKARRVCAERYPHIVVASTIDILAHESVIAAFSKREMSNAVLAALEVAHMQVQAHQLDWVMSQVPAEKLVNCVSLPRSVRRRAAELLNVSSNQSAAS